MPSPNRFPDVPRFPLPLVLQEIEGDDLGRKWLVREDFPFIDMVGRRITVPAGFVTDLASIPKVLWNVLPPFGRYEDAAVVHDFLYTYQDRYSADVSKGFADDHLMQGMVARGCGWWERHTVYWGVKLGGFVAWNHHREDLASGKVTGPNSLGTVGLGAGVTVPSPPTRPGSANK